jgi:hypothetical protein
LDSQ